jgi:probable HAF family extracellular repeat protein
VAGVSYISGGQAEHAFLYSNGAMQDLGTLGGTNSYGYGINASGQVTGGATTAAGTLHVFVTDPTTFAMTDLGTLTGYTNSVATGINAGGQVTGYAYSGSTQYRAFVSDATTNTMTDLGTLGGARAQGLGINTSGQVVGTSLISNGTWHGFVYSNGQILDLNSLLSASDAATYVITSAAGINDNGQIVANAYTTSVVTPGAVVLLLTPAAADAPAKVTCGAQSWWLAAHSAPSHLPLQSSGALVTPVPPQCAAPQSSTGSTSKASASRRADWRTPKVRAGVEAPAYSVRQRQRRGVVLLKK